MDHAYAAPRPVKADNRCKRKVSSLSDSYTHTLRIELMGKSEPLYCPT